MNSGVWFIRQEVVALDCAAKDAGTCPSGVYGNIIGKALITYSLKTVTVNWDVRQGSET